MLKILEPIQSLFRGGSYLGIDIGTASIKLVELAAEGGRPTLKNYGLLENRGHLERVNEAIQTSSLKILDRETAEILTLLLRQTKPTTKEAAASLPAFSAFTALLDLPLMSAKETAQAMQYQAKAFIPLPLTEVTIDWLPVGQYEEPGGIKKQQVFLIAVPNEQIKRYQSIFRFAGLNLRVLELESLSLARILTEGDPTNSLIVDIGARSTAIAVAGGGLLKYSAQSDFAGASLTQAIAGGLGININRAEQLKKQRGLTGVGGEYEVSTLMLPYLDVILNEVGRVKNIYEKNYHSKIERVILAGGGANLLGLEKYFAERFSLPTIKADPFQKINYPSSLGPLVNSLGPPFAVALGLAARKFR
jgi:type IV pilus assembly protein PilM